MSTCKDLKESAFDLAVVAIDIVWPLGKKAPGMAAKALSDPKVTKAIEDELAARAKELLDKQPKGVQSATLSGDEAEKFGKKLGEDFLKIGTHQFKDVVVAQVKQTQEYKALEQAAKDVKAAFECSPLGVWVNEHETVLYIVGGVAALGAGVAMYLLRTGDTVGGFATDHATTTIKIGKVSITPALTEFTPSARKVGASIKTEVKLSRVQATLNLAGLSTPDAAKVSGDGSVKLILDQEWSIMATGALTYGLGDSQLLDKKLLPSTGWAPSTYKLALGIDYSGKSGLAFNIYSRLDNGDLTLSPKVGYSRTYGKTSYSFDTSTNLGLNGVQGVRGVTFGGSLTRKEEWWNLSAGLNGGFDRTTGWNGMLNLKIEFDGPKKK